MRQLQYDVNFYVKEMFLVIYLNLSDQGLKLYPNLAPSVLNERKAKNSLWTRLFLLLSLNYCLRFVRDRLSEISYLFYLLAGISQSVAMKGLLLSIVRNKFCTTHPFRILVLWIILVLCDLKIHQVTKSFETRRCIILLDFLY